MATTNMQFGQSAINVVLNDGQLPAKLSTDANGNTVLDSSRFYSPIVVALVCRFDRQELQSPVSKPNNHPAAEYGGFLTNS